MSYGGCVFGVGVLTCFGFVGLFNVLLVFLCGVVVCLVLSRCVLNGVCITVLLCLSVVLCVCCVMCCVCCGRFVLLHKRGMCVLQCPVMCCYWCV